MALALAFFIALGLLALIGFGLMFGFWVDEPHNDPYRESNELWR